MGMAYAMKGQFAEAISACEKSVQVDDSPMLLSGLAYTYAIAGKRREAEQTVQKLEGVAKKRYVCSYEIALVYIALGQKDLAFRWFQKSLDDRSDCLVWLKVDPRLDAVREDRRFQELMKQVGTSKFKAVSHQPSAVSNHPPLGAGRCYKLSADT
jgi:tetratricopeptide (TPR) repeat protein